MNRLLQKYHKPALYAFFLPLHLIGQQENMKLIVKNIFYFEAGIRQKRMIKSQANTLYTAFYLI